MFNEAAKMLSLEKLLRIDKCYSARRRLEKIYKNLSYQKLFSKRFTFFYADKMFFKAKIIVETKKL